MKIFEHHLRNASSLLLQYNGSVPFSAWIKNHFSENKKFGSKDRKQITHLCYSYFRLGKALPAIGIEEKILVGLFLTGDISSSFLQYFKPEWDEKIALPLMEKVAFICGLYQIETTAFLAAIFPWQNDLSEGVDADAFTMSHLIQPDLFLRLRPKHEGSVKQKLAKAEIAFTNISDSCIAIPNASKIDELIALNKEAVVQDRSSQEVAAFFELISFTKNNYSVWDCCAASGGKSIMLYDYNKNIQLTVSDIRQSILFNLKERFREAGLTQYKSFVRDLSASDINLPDQKFDLVVCDVPCSGSGTWSRTPEQLHYFETAKIDHYAKLQRVISTNVIPAIAKDGYLLYITCSVFKKENEAAVAKLEAEGLSLIKMEVIKGYDHKADTMFAALLRKN